MKTLEIKSNNMGLTIVSAYLISVLNSTPINYYAASYRL